MGNKNCNQAIRYGGNVLHDHRSDAVNGEHDFVCWAGLYVEKRIVTEVRQRPQRVVLPSPLL